jgi:hypothetical protein
MAKTEIKAIESKESLKPCLPEFRRLETLHIIDKAKCQLLGVKGELRLRC